MHTVSALATDLYTNVLEKARPIHAVDAAAALAALWAVITAVRVARRRLKTTRLRGPSSTSLLYGVGKDLAESSDAGAMYEAWVEEYGVVYQVPSTLGQTRIVLADPKAIAHFYARETWTYVLTAVVKVFFEKGVSATGVACLQRKSLTPAFSSAAIRNLSPVFYDSAYKAKGAWDALIEAAGNDSAIIEVQSWYVNSYKYASYTQSHLRDNIRMNHISLDTIGIAGFSHDFGSLDGRPASVTEVFDAFGKSSAASAVNVVFLLLSQVFPFLIRLPTSRSKLISRLNTSMGEISSVLLDRTRKEKELGIGEDKRDNSIIGLLIKAESEDAELRLSHEEIMAQANESVAPCRLRNDVHLTWALIELAQNPAAQTKLREELLTFGSDPTYEQLSTSLPYLDAVVHETLRMHPAVPEFTRIAVEDDVIPLSQPVRTKSGELVDSISIAKDTLIVINIPLINRSAAIWGPDAKAWRPERWLEEDGIPKKAQEVQGHRHLLTFVDGPRTCLGKGFAVAEFKVFTFLIRLPTSRSKLISRLNISMGEISSVLLDRTRKEKELGIREDKADNSIIGLLIKAESEDAELRLSHEEIMAQANESVAPCRLRNDVRLTWALIELARHPAAQTKLREELLAFGSDPTYEQLSTNLPYLDAVVHETLRTYPPIPEFTRIAVEDDVIPLSQPVRAKFGEVVDSISIAKDTVIAINIPSINRSAAIWGPDAKAWRPERWLEEDGIPKKAQEVQGHRHLLTFVDGPRTCLGKGFAVAEFKIVLSVLVKNFVLELRDGLETKLEMGRGLLPRPKIVGEEGTKVPFRVCFEFARHPQDEPDTYHGRGRRLGFQFQSDEATVTNVSTGKRPEVGIGAIQQ
ncbi:cytochrome P450 [Gyrodon lividus]|nr:cytochrome P450 [Gyrodon lividus]